MAQPLTAAAQIRTSELADSHEAVLAEALFASTVQPSDCPGPEQVRRAVAVTLLRLGNAVCAGEVAAEFGDHPDTAAARMTWALATIRGCAGQAWTSPLRTSLAPAESAPRGARGRNRSLNGSAGFQEREHRQDTAVVVGGLREGQFGEDAAYVFLDGPLGDPQPAGDAGV